MLIVQVTENSNNGHAFHRVVGPARHMSRRPGVTVIDVPAGHRHLAWAIESADVLILHLIDPDLTAAVHRRRLRGQTTLVEASDQFFDLQPWSAFSVGWLDRGRQDQFLHTLATVDAVQTSTPYLAEVWKSKARRVIVAGNAREVSDELLPRQQRPLTVGWAGSVTHLADWFLLAPTLAAWVAHRPGTMLAAMTDARGRDFAPLPNDRYRFQPLGTHAEYRQFLRDLDIVVVPLLDTPFNRGRTDLKVWDLADAGAIGIFAAREPYRRVVEAGRTGFLYRTPAELIARLDELANHPERWNDMRTAAHAASVANARIDVAGPRLEAYRELLGGSRPAVEIPAWIRADADADGRYLRLRIGAAEQLVHDAVTGPAPSREAALTAAVQQTPDDISGRRALARVQLSADRPLAALATLEARIDSPDATPGLLLDAASAAYASGDPQLARDLAARAVAANPAAASSWTTLLKLDPDAALADRAAANQPRNYFAGLTAIRRAPPEEQTARLFRWLEEFAREAEDEERPYLAAAWVKLWDSLLGRESNGAAAPLAAAAAEHFPDSAAVAARRGWAALAAGDAPQAASAFARAAWIARVARGYALEHPVEPPDLAIWSVGAYACRHREVVDA